MAPVCILARPIRSYAHSGPMLADATHFLIDSTLRDLAFDA